MSAFAPLIYTVVGALVGAAVSVWTTGVQFSRQHRAEIAAIRRQKLERLYEVLTDIDRRCSDVHSAFVLSVVSGKQTDLAPVTDQPFSEMNMLIAIYAEGIKPLADEIEDFRGKYSTVVVESRMTMPPEKEPDQIAAIYAKANPLHEQLRDSIRRALNATAELARRQTEMPTSKI